MQKRKKYLRVESFLKPFETATPPQGERGEKFRGDTSGTSHGTQIETALKQIYTCLEFILCLRVLKKLNNFGAKVKILLRYKAVNSGCSGYSWAI